MNINERAKSAATRPPRVLRTQVPRYSMAVSLSSTVTVVDCARPTKNIAVTHSLWHRRMVERYPDLHECGGVLLNVRSSVFGVSLDHSHVTRAVTLALCVDDELIMGIG